VCFPAYSTGRPPPSTPAEFEYSLLPPPSADKLRSASVRWFDSQAHDVEAGAVTLWYSACSGNGCFCWSPPKPAVLCTSFSKFLCEIAFFEMTVAVLSFSLLFEHPPPDEKTHDHSIASPTFCPRLSYRSVTFLISSEAGSL